jgi:6-phosphofructokinase
MPQHNAFYAQSGGVAAVINASAAGVIETARQHPAHIGTVYAGRPGRRRGRTRRCSSTAHA